MIRRTCVTVAVALAVGTALAAPAAADVVYPILPNQYFTGLVNGATDKAQILVGCFGPATGTGHPLAGQTLEVRPASKPSPGATDVGFTGSSGTSVLALFDSQSSTSGVSFTAYYTQAAIPTSLTLPCSGTGKVAFSPRPGSTSAVTAYVEVTYVAQP